MWLWGCKVNPPPLTVGLSQTPKEHSFYLFLYWVKSRIVRYEPLGHVTRRQHKGLPNILYRKRSVRRCKKKIGNTVKTLYPLHCSCLKYYTRDGAQVLSSRELHRLSQRTLVEDAGRKRSLADYIIYVGHQKNKGHYHQKYHLRQEHLYPSRQER